MERTDGIFIWIGNDQALACKVLNRIKEKGYTCSFDSGCRTTAVFLRPDFRFSWWDYHENIIPAEDNIVTVFGAKDMPESAWDKIPSKPVSKKMTLLELIVLAEKTFGKKVELV